METLAPVRTPVVSSIGRLLGEASGIEGSPLGWPSCPQSGGVTEECSADTLLGMVEIFPAPSAAIAQHALREAIKVGSQMENLYGEVADDNPAVHDVGWMALAQDRAQWTHLPGDFAAAQT